MNNIDRIYSFVYLAIGFLFTELFFFRSYPFKERLHLPIFCTAYMLATLSYAKLKNVRITKEAVFWMVITLVICFRVNFVNPFYAFLPRVVCAAYYTYSLGNSFTDGKGSSKYIIVDGICTMIFMPFASFLSIFRGIVTSFRQPKEKKDIARVIPALAGVLMAILALYMIIPQLIKADRNFLSGFGKILDDISAFFDRIFRKIYLPSRIMVSLPVACYLYSLIYNSLSEKKYGRPEKKIVDDFTDSVKIAPALTAQILLYAVCAVYALFIFSQFRYLFGAFTGKLYEGYTYSEYAVTGFWELCRVSMINLSLMALSCFIVKKEDRSKLRVPLGCISVISLALLGTALAKMIMYIATYGLTEKRIISTVFLFWLVEVFVLCIMRLTVEINLVKIALLSFAAVFTLLFSIDMKAVSNRYNYYKYGVGPAPTEKVSTGNIYTQEYDAESGKYILVKDSVKYYPYADDNGRYSGYLIGEYIDEASGETKYIFTVDGMDEKDYIVTSSAPFECIDGTIYYRWDVMYVPAHIEPDAKYY